MAYMDKWPSKLHDCIQEYYGYTLVSTNPIKQSDFTKFAAHKLISENRYLWGYYTYDTESAWGDGSMDTHCNVMNLCGPICIGILCNMPEERKQPQVFSQGSPPAKTGAESETPDPIPSWNRVQNT